MNPKKVYIIAAVLTLILASLACNQPAPGLAPTPTEGPAAAPASGIVSLNYDETNADALTPGQSRLIALYLRDAEAQGTTQAAMEAAIRAIQAEAAASNATVFEGSSLKLDQHQAWLVWVSNADGVDFPADVSDVFDHLPAGPGRVWIQVPFADGVPLRTKDAFSCTGCRFWAVAVK